MNIKDLVTNVEQLDMPQLERFYRKIQSLYELRRKSEQERQEQAILKELQGHRFFAQLRFDYLIAQRDLEQLTAIEYQELLTLVEAFEQHELERLRLLTKLAQVRNISLPQVMKLYSITPVNYA